MTLGVTGATGRLGRRVAGRISAAGMPQRLVVRDTARAPDLPGADVTQAEYGDTEATVRALEGLDTVLMVSGSESADRVERHRSFVDAAVRAGVRHLVYTSFVRASPTSTFTLARDHWETEEYIRASGLTFTFLRNNMYADFLPLLVSEDGALRGPAGSGRVAAVAQDDLAEVTATVLQTPGDHDGVTLNLTGPEALTLSEVAVTLSTATGRAVPFVDETVAQAYASRVGLGVPDWQVDAWVSTYTAIAAGELADVSPDVQRVTGHPPRTLAAVLAL